MQTTDISNHLLWPKDRNRLRLVLHLLLPLPSPRLQTLRAALWPRIMNTGFLKSHDGVVYAIIFKG